MSTEPVTRAGPSTRIGQTRTAADAAYERLRREILQGALQAGDRLTEAALAKRLGLSRTPVREAIGRLVSEGFVERGEGYSTRVARFDAADHVHVFEIRARLEGYAARQAALNATRDEVVELERLAASMVSRTPPQGEDDRAVIARANEAFHRLVYQAARSPRVQVVMATIVDVGVVARTYRTFGARDLERSTHHHVEIAEAIAARAPDWAEHVMTAHVLAALAALRAGQTEIETEADVGADRSEAA